MLYFVIYLFLEVLISVNISSAIGGLMTFLEIVLSAFIGIAILINFRKILVENMTAVSYNCIDLEQFQKLNLFTLFGALLFIVPGFLTDIIGALMQFSLFTTMLVTRYNLNKDKCKTDFMQDRNITKDSDVIDVEVISDKSTIS